jgi:site-specific recombinase XerD
VKYIFNIVSRDDSEFDKFRKEKNFIRFINQNLKKLAEDNGITSNISTYWARHSFATTIVRNGASLEQASEALNHQELRTTQGYFAGFEDEQKREIANKLMNFD